VPAAQVTAYWEDRAHRFAARGAGLAAVCSYGMPAFYNWSIHLFQRLALRRWLRVPPGTRVLEIGCGVGRWSRRLARRGATVTGIDLSRKMIARARERAAADGLGDRCRFVVADVCAPPLTGQFDVVFGVTVLQHILDPIRFQSAVTALTEHLAPGGRVILLEAAPSRPTGRCDSHVFVARDARLYLDAFRRAGLECVSMTGVDPAPFKTWFLPRYRTLPRAVALGGLAAITAAGFIPDLLLGRLWTRASWHKVFVLTHRQTGQS
jgi:SAM-dependent methyltransferase